MRWWAGAARGNRWPTSSGTGSSGVSTSRSRRRCSFRGRKPNCWSNRCSSRFPAPAAPIRIADACTGSGCVAVAIARERPSARLVATDISDTALAVARRNAARHGVADRVRLVRADLFRGITGRFDAIVANPPYVPYCDRPALDAEVAHCEPALAIFGGEDGFSVIEQLVPQATDLIREGGMLMFEFGFGQAEAVAELIALTPGIALVGLRNDLQGIPRIAIARRIGSSDVRLTTDDQ